MNFIQNVVIRQNDRRTNNSSVFKLKYSVLTFKASSNFNLCDLIKACFFSYFFVIFLIFKHLALQHLIISLLRNIFMSCSLDDRNVSEISVINRCISAPDI